MKKILKGMLILFVVLIFAAGGFVYYVYRTVNNVDQYSDRFVDYETELAEYEGSEFEDFIFYDKDTCLFYYKVPFVLLYKTVNAKSMTEFLGLPKDAQIKQIGLELDIENKKVDIYLDISYKDLIDTCLIIKTDYMVSTDRTCLEMRYDDYYIVNDYVTDKLREYVKSEKGDLMFTQYFPRDVEYYQMPNFRTSCVYGVSYEGGFINAIYDIQEALEFYLQFFPNESLKDKLKAVELAVETKGIAH
ncbi:MAG: hypothetical protein IJF87_02835 [Erysipelotrichaceae bacterium]|nr:hypothetical protein [Erysipelotrichaceae bacterium]